MKKMIIAAMLIMSSLFTYSQNKKIEYLEKKGISIISKLDEVKQLQKAALKNKEHLNYMFGEETSNFVEIIVGVDKADRVERVYFYKYLSNKKLYKLDMINDKYILINY